MGADIEAQDSNGNTALHMCVFWKLKEMYIFLEDIAEKQGIADLSMVQNQAEPGLAHGLTCMQLAVFNNDPDMFNWILERKRVLQWTYGRVSSSLVRTRTIPLAFGSLSRRPRWLRWCCSAHP